MFASDSTRVTATGRAGEVDPDERPRAASVSGAVRSICQRAGTAARASAARDGASRSAGSGGVQQQPAHRVGATAGSPPAARAAAASAGPASPGPGQPGGGDRVALGPDPGRRRALGRQVLRRAARRRAGASARRIAVEPDVGVAAGTAAGEGRTVATQGGAWLGQGRRPPRRSTASGSTRPGETSRCAGERVAGHPQLADDGRAGGGCGPGACRRCAATGRSRGAAGPAAASAVELLPGPARACPAARAPRRATSRSSTSTSTSRAA